MIRRKPLSRSITLAAAAFAGSLLAQGPAFAEAPAACGGTALFETLGEDDRAAIREEAADVLNGQGRLFRIEGEDRAPSFLFGTMHLSDPRVVTLPPAAEEAFAAADRLVVETLEIADEAAIAATVLMRPDLLNLPQGTELADLLGDDEKDDLLQALAGAGLSPEAVRTLQPWFLTASLAIPPCEIERQMEGTEILDLSLISRAELEGKDLDGLETSLEQIEALASLPLDLQAENLLALLGLRDRLPDIFETMIVLYEEGRIGEIVPTIERLAPSGTDEASAAAVYTAFEEAVVTRRNHRMAERLQPILDEGGAFVAVGALHLPGEEGLVELLAAQGWRVEPAD